MRDMTSALHRPALITELVAQSLNRDTDRVVMVLADGRTQNAGELRDAISRYVQLFDTLSPKPVRAALLSKNRPEVPGVFYAFSFAGIISTPLHPMGSLEDYLYVLGDAGKTPAATRESIFMDGYVTMTEVDGSLLAKWARIREIRDAVNKEIEVLRADGKLGSSLQATVELTVGGDDHALLSSLGDDLKFVFITSTITLLAGDAPSISVTPSTSVKCERCWHYRDDVGVDAEHPTLCGRCTSNLYGAGETRTVA